MTKTERDFVAQSILNNEIPVFFIAIYILIDIELRPHFVKFSLESGWNLKKDGWSRNFLKFPSESGRNCETMHFVKYFVKSGRNPEKSTFCKILT